MKNKKLIIEQALRQIKKDFIGYSDFDLEDLCVLKHWSGKEDKYYFRQAVFFGFKSKDTFILYQYESRLKADGSFSEDSFADTFYFNSFYQVQMWVRDNGEDKIKSRVVELAQRHIQEKRMDSLSEILPEKNEKTNRVKI